MINDPFLLGNKRLANAYAGGYNCWNWHTASCNRNWCSVLKGVIGNTNCRCRESKWNCSKLGFQLCKPVILIMINNLRQVEPERNTII